MNLGLAVVHDTLYSIRKYNQTHIQIKYINVYIYIYVYIYINIRVRVGLFISFIYPFIYPNLKSLIPVVPHKAVAEVSKIGNL